MEENLKIFSERLRATRKLKGLSQTDLAKRADFQPSAISHFENGRRSPSFDNLKRLADTLGVTVDYLLGRVEEPKSSGPVAQQLFRDFERMSHVDQKALAKMAEVLAKKNEESREGNIS
jgi:transcriptional regulator with XRE-family HTH domain